MKKLTIEQAQEIVKDYEFIIGKYNEQGMRALALNIKTGEKANAEVIVVFEIDPFVFMPLTEFAKKQSIKFDIENYLTI